LPHFITNEEKVTIRNQNVSCCGTYRTPVIKFGQMTLLVFAKRGVLSLQLWFVKVADGMACLSMANII
jgi:hypothetical protein